MYASSFGLQRSPFTPSRGLAAPYLSRRHSNILAHLLLRMQGAGGLVLLTVESTRTGVFACRRLVDQMPDNGRVGFMLKPGSDTSLSTCLRSVIDAFRIPRPPEATDASTQFALLQADLQRSSDEGKDNVLILGHAQEYPDELLLHLASLCELEAGEHPLLRIILVGPPALRERLAHPTLQPLSRQKVAEYHLDGLQPGETVEYIQHQMASVGHQGALPFSEKALMDIHALTHGAPELIDTLCDRAMTRAHTENKKTVDHKIVAAAAQPGDPARKPGHSLFQRHKVPRWLLPAAGVGALLLVGWLMSGASEGELQASTPSVEPVATPTLPIAPPPDTPRPANPPADQAPPEAVTQADLTAVAPTPLEPAAGTTSTTKKDERPMLETLKDGPEDTWSPLGRLWGLNLNGNNPCDQALSQGHQCFRATDLTVDTLRQLNRPGLLRLSESGVDRWVMLESMNKDSVTLSSTGVQWVLPLTEFESTWKGAFSSLWRLPPGQTRKVFAATSSEPAGRWLDMQLKALQEQNKLPATQDSFEARLAAFQKLHELRSDGKATPTTFLLVNRFTGVEEPKLISTSP